jgi:hypothetical protein
MNVRNPLLHERAAFCGPWARDGHHPAYAWLDVNNRSAFQRAADFCST